MKRLMVVVLGLLSCERASPTTEIAAPASASAAARWVAAAPAGELDLFEVPAVVRTAADAEAVVAAPTRARVVQVWVRSGDRVLAGDPIADLVPADLVQAAAVLRSAGERLATHRRWLGQLHGHRAEGLVRGADVFAIEAEVAELQAQVAQARAQLRAAGVSEAEVARLRDGEPLTLRAPHAAVVRAVAAVPGSVVEAGAVLAQLASDRPARIEVRGLQPLPTELTLTFAAATGQVVALQAAPTASALDGDGGAVLQWYEPAVPVALPAGLAGRVRARAPAGHAVQVPARAVVRRAAGAVVWAETPGGPVERPVVVLGVAGPLAVVRGLPAGTRVAAQGDLVAAGAER